jgi:hypothetical protein
MKTQKKGKVKFTFEIPDWYNQQKYDEKYKHLDLSLIWDNIASRLDLFKSHSTYNNHLNLDKKNPITFYDSLDKTNNSQLADDYIENFKILVEDPIFNPLFYIDTSNMYGYITQEHLSNKMIKKNLHYTGVHPLSYRETKREVKKIEGLINGEEPLSPLFGNKAKIANEDEKHIVDLHKKLYDNSFTFHRPQALPDEEKTKMEKLVETNRDFINDYMFTIDPYSDAGCIDLRIDLTKSDNVLYDSFKKVIKSLRKEQNILKGDDILSSNGNKLKYEKKIVRQFKNYRIFEFIDLSFWALTQNKKYDEETISEILYKEFYDKSPIERLTYMKKLLKNYFTPDSSGQYVIHQHNKTNSQYKFLN